MRKCDGKYTIHMYIYIYYYLFIHNTIHGSYREYLTTRKAGDFPAAKTFKTRMDELLRKVLSAPALLFATFFDFHKIADVVSTGAL